MQSTSLLSQLGSCGENSSEGHQGRTSPTLCVTQGVLIMGPGSQASGVHHVPWHITVPSSSSQNNSSAQLVLMRIDTRTEQMGLEEETLAWLGSALSQGQAANTCVILPHLGRLVQVRGKKSQWARANSKQKQWFTHHGESVILKNTSS